MTERPLHGERLLEKLAKKDAVVGVIGLGYVGLPLGLVFEEAGFSYGVKLRLPPGGYRSIPGGAHGFVRRRAPLLPALRSGRGIGRKLAARR